MLLNFIYCLFMFLDLVLISSNSYLQLSLETNNGSSFVDEESKLSRIK